MAKFSGLVGYVTQEEQVPGVWSPVEKTAMMKGDVIRLSSTYQDNGKVNSDMSLNHRVSLIGDAYAFENYFKLKWVDFNGLRVEINSIEMQRPRIIITLGGVWNGI
jgi:hypothetical protein